MKKTTATILSLVVILIAGCSSTPETLPSNPTEPSSPPTEEPATSPTSEPSTTDPAPTEIPEPSPTPGYIRESYFPDGGLRQTLDIMFPDDATGPFPVLFVAIGTTLDKLDPRLVIEQLSFFCKRGYVVLGVDYRRLPENTYPAQYEDVFCAFAWLHANANLYNLDTERIFVLGDSIGGMFAVMLGTVDDYSLYLNDCPYTLPGSSLVRGVIGADVAYDLTLPESLNFARIVNGIIVPLLGNTLQENPELWAEASPATHVDGSEPPFLIISTEPTSWMAVSQIESFTSVLESYEVEVETIIIDTMSHRPGIFDSWFSADEREQVFVTIEAFMIGVLTE